MSIVELGLFFCATFQPKLRKAYAGDTSATAGGRSGGTVGRARKTAAIFVGVVIGNALAACGGWSADDQTAANIGTRNAAELLVGCASDDAGATTCTPSLVRARSRVIFCASQRALTVHGTPFDGGTPCPKP